MLPRLMLINNLIKKGALKIYRIFYSRINFMSQFYDFNGPVKNFYAKKKLMKSK